MAAGAGLPALLVLQTSPGAAPHDWLPLEPLLWFAKTSISLDPTNPSKHIKVFPKPESAKHPGQSGHRTEEPQHGSSARAAKGTEILPHVYREPLHSFVSNPFLRFYDRLWGFGPSCLQASEVGAESSPDSRWFGYASVDRVCVWKSQKLSVLSASSETSVWSRVSPPLVKYLYPT